MDYTSNLKLKKPSSTDNVDVADINYNMDKIDNALYEKDMCSMYRLNRDSNGIFTEIQRKRKDGTLIMKSVLSGGASPKYTTRTEIEYDQNGTTIIKTTVFTLLYDGDIIVGYMIT